MSSSPHHVVLHASAYDRVPSGARGRAVGLAAAFLRGGHRVTVQMPRGLSFRALVEQELGGVLPGERYAEVATDLDPSRPLRRFRDAQREAERTLPRDAELFLTDYHPVLDRVPTALTVHDLRYHAAARFESFLRTAFFRAQFPAIADRAAALVVPSTQVAAELRAHVGVPRGRLVLAPNAVGRAWREAGVASGAPRHLVTVGVSERRKRFDVLVAALRMARERADVLPLVAAGRRSGHVVRVLRGARDLMHVGGLRWVEAPGDAELVPLVRDAAALLHPSAYEGFGTTTLEAFACGVPVIAARVPAVEEVAGPEATWVAEGDARAWADAIVAASARAAGRGERAQSRRARAAEFTWDRTAAAILGGVLAHAQ